MGVTNHPGPNAPPEPRKTSGIGDLTRAHQAVRTIMKDWRDLTAAAPAPTSPRKTLIACSGGADSSALALALAVGGAEIAGLAHIVHDLRPPDQSLPDRDAVQRLADRLGTPCFTQSITTTCDATATQDQPGNLEAAARDQRYAALTSMARDCGAAFVATGHHADDQLETMVMALLRGSGPAGLRGVAPSRPLDEHTALIRPMLRVTRQQAEELCTLAGVTWQFDHTNADTSRFRAALRHGPIADMLALRPHGSLKASRTASLIRDTVQLVDDRARTVFGDDFRWPRAALRDELPVVLGAGLRSAALNLTQGRHADKLTGNAIDSAITAIRDASTEPRRFDWPGGLLLHVTANEVSLSIREQ